MQILTAVSVALSALVCLGTALVVTDRLRGGLVIGLIPFCVVFGVAYAIGRRQHARTFCDWTVILFVSLVILPVAEIAFYVVHASLYAQTKQTAVTAEDIDAMEVYRVVAREERGNVSMLAPISTPYFTINSDGYRGAEFGPRTSGSVRIAVAGGSAVFGTGVADASTLPAQLQVRVQEMTDSPVDVLNLGQEAITFEAEVRILESLMARLQPDIAIFHNGANDFVINGWAPSVLGRQSMFHVKDSVSARLIDRLQQSLIVARGRATLLPSRAPSATQEADVIRRALAAYSESRLRAEALCSSHRLTCLFFLQPVITDRTSPTYPEAVEMQTRETDFRGFGQLYRRFVAAIIERHPRTLSLSVAIASDERVIFLDWAHLSRAGNELLAQRIARELSATGFTSH